MLDVIFVPIENWPGKQRPPYSVRKRAVFRIAYGQRIDLLEAELKKLGATGVIIQAFFSRADIRNDGWPRSSARPKQPGVVLTFQNRKKESLSFPCDTYDSWEDNLYAIALSLEALRTVDRYGVTQHEEQYQGWKRLPAPANEATPDSSWALAHLARLAGTTEAALRGNTAALELAYKSAAKRCHPDAGGTPEMFHTLTNAAKILGVRA